MGIVFLTVFVIFRSLGGLHNLGGGVGDGRSTIGGLDGGNYCCSCSSSGGDSGRITVGGDFSGESSIGWVALDCGFTRITVFVVTVVRSC